MKMPNTSPFNRERPETIRRMFDEIAPTYDRLNHMLSFGLDRRWRHTAVDLLSEKRGGTFLDIAAGSGDVALDLGVLHPRRVVASDFAFNMLSVFRAKLGTGRREGISLVSCDAHALPFRGASFDGTIVAFGIRNFANRLRALEEMLRVLRPGGISVILELTQPSLPVAAQLYRAYSRWGIPAIGRFISKNSSAYSYLPSSIDEFPTEREFLALMTQAGFISPISVPLTFGAATIYSGRRGLI
jgi:demethylmenaquinone methyltransferase/2-methoxy-6-polyprenyl-1,4-benzoquinol methylase